MEICEVDAVFVSFVPVVVAVAVAFGVVVADGGKGLALGVMMVVVGVVRVVVVGYGFIGAVAALVVWGRVAVLLGVLHGAVALVGTVEEGLGGVPGFLELTAAWLLLWFGWGGHGGGRGGHVLAVVVRGARSAGGDAGARVSSTAVGEWDLVGVRAMVRGAGWHRAAW